MESKISDDILRTQTQLIGPRYAGATLAKISLGDGIDEAVVDWVKKKKGFLVYLGAPGVGKTYFCSALMPWIHGKTSSYRYWKERDFFSRLRNCMDGSGDYLREIPLMADDEFLLIDDVGSSGINAWRAEVLFALIDYRYESQKPTVFTSNLTREALSSALGERASSRLFAKENAIIEIHDGLDLRTNGM